MKLKTSAAIVASLLLLVFLLSIVAAALGNLDENALKSGIKSIDDLEDAAKGTEKVLGSVKVFENVVPGIGDVGKLDFLKNVAKLSDEAAEDVSKIADVKGVEKLTHNIVTASANSKEGFEWEAKVAGSLKEEGSELIELGRKKTVDYVNPETGKWVYNAEVEMDNLWKNGDGKIIVDEVKAVDWNYIKTQHYYPGRLNDLEIQFRKLRAIDDAENIRLVSKYQVTEEVSNLAKDYDVLIKMGTE